jgi:hypothetical protein
MPTNLTRRVTYECEVLHMPAEKISLGEQRLSALRGVTKSANNAIVVAHGNSPLTRVAVGHFILRIPRFRGLAGLLACFLPADASERVRAIESGFARNCRG